jgi:alpha-galactosidase
MKLIATTLKTGLAIALIFSLSGCTGNKTIKVENVEKQVSPEWQKLARTPPMGWNSWNGLGKEVSEELIKATADSMVTTGLRDAGFEYIVIDDYWHGGRDSATGLLYPDPKRFPNGMKALADYVHGRGLKFGIYSDAGTKTCGEQPGSYGYEDKDAKLFAEWGVDYLKYDYCFCNDFASENNDYMMAIERYKKMGDALKATGRPIVFSICEWGPRAPWLWGKDVGGHLWRTSYDVHDFWDKPRNDISPIGILTSLDVAANLERFAGPGGWNDPDMLVVGLKNKGNVKGGGCNEIEYRTQMSMWCMLAAPLMIGCDIRNMDETTRTILLNKDLISIDQDTLGKQGFRVYRKDGLEAFQKPLSGGRVAIAFLNRNSAGRKMTTTYKELELEPEARFKVYDVWKHSEITQPQGTFSADLKSHETLIYILSPVTK